MLKSEAPSRHKARHVDTQLGCAVPDRTIVNPGELEESEWGCAELAKLRGVTIRALRLYESRGLISPRRKGRLIAYSQRDSQRIALILKAKKLGFTLAEIGPMINVEDGSATSGGLHLTAQKCLQQIDYLEGQMKNIIDALAELRQIHRELCCKTGNATADQAP